MRKLFSIILSLLLFITMVPSHLKAEEEGNTFEAKGINVEKHSPEEIRAYAAAHPIQYEGNSPAEDTFKTAPSLTVPYSPGELSDETLTNGLNALNIVRYISGIGEVTLDDTYNKQEQAAALIMQLNGNLNHYPPQPEGLDDETYQLGYTGASSGNLARGYSSLAYSVIYMWMNDSDSSNIVSVGHRTWCLNPFMGKTGFGSVRLSSGNSGYTAMKSFDGSGNGVGKTAGLWPGQNMPVEYFRSDYAWSICLPQTQISSADSVTVAMKNVKTNETMTFSSSSVPEGGYFNVQENWYNASSDYSYQAKIIWRPNTSIIYMSGDEYEITISGLKGEDVCYHVRFFQLDNSKPQYSIEESKITVYPNQTKDVKILVSPEGTQIREVKALIYNTGYGPMPEVKYIGNNTLRITGASDTSEDWKYRLNIDGEKTEVRFTVNTVVPDTTYAHALWKSEEGSLTFFRSYDNYEKGQGTFTDIKGTSYTGYLYPDVENAASGVLWSDNLMYLSSVSVAEGQTISPVYMSMWFGHTRYGTGLKEFDGRGFDTSNVKNMSSLFAGDADLTYVDLSSFDTSNITDSTGTAGFSGMKDMFSGCSKLETIVLGEKFLFKKDVVLPEGTWVNKELGLKKTAEELVEGYNSSWAGTWKREFDYSLGLSEEEIDLGTVSTQYQTAGKEFYLTNNGSGSLRVDFSDITIKDDPEGIFSIVYHGMYPAWTSGIRTIAGGERVLLYVYSKRAQEYVPGKYTVTLSVKDVDGKAEPISIPVTITNTYRQVTGITLDKTELTLKKGFIEQINAVIKPEDAYYKDVTWTSSDPSVATVDESGIVTAVGAGTAVITAHTHDDLYSASCTVTVTDETVDSITLDKTSVEIFERDEVEVNATVVPEEAIEFMSWTSSEESVATVRDGGTRGTIVGVKEGTTVITVKESKSGKTASVSVTVKKRFNPVVSVKADEVTRRVSDSTGQRGIPQFDEQGNVTGVVYFNLYDCLDKVTIETADGETYYGDPAEVKETLEKKYGMSFTDDIYAGELYQYQYAAEHKEGIPVGDYEFTYTFEGISCTYIFHLVEDSAVIPTKYEVTRLSGKLRYDTAIKAADELKSVLGVDKFDTVILATGENFADALGGGYLAAKKSAPILLTKESQKDKAIEYIRDNVTEGGTVYILGGEGAVPSSCLEGLGAYHLVRLSGKTRYDTNLAILTEAGVSTEEILIASGENFAAALAASASGRPMLLVNTKKNVLTDAQKAFLSEHASNTLYILGGTGAVSADIETALKEYSTPERVKGASRYETSVEIAKKFFPEADEALVAFSDKFPDGLCAGPLAYALKSPILLTKEGKEASLTAYCTESNIHSGYIVGGEAAIPDITALTVFSLPEDQEIVKR